MKIVQYQLKLQPYAMAIACCFATSLCASVATLPARADQIEITTVASGANESTLKKEAATALKLPAIPAPSTTKIVTPPVINKPVMPALPKVAVPTSLAVPYSSTSKPASTPQKAAPVSLPKPSQNDINQAIDNNKATIMPGKAVNIVGYNRNIKQEHFKDLSKDAVLSMQKQLEGIYRLLPDWQHDYSLKGQPLNDGIVGPITLSWLQRFAFSFKVNAEGDYAPALAKNVDRIAQFAARHKDEVTILMSPEFEAWDFMQADKVKQQDFQIRRQGSEKELIELVNRFRSQRKVAPRTAPRSNFDESAFYYFKLTQGDLDILGGKDQIVQILTTLKDKEFNSSEALRVAVTKAMGGREHIVSQIWPLIERYAGDFDGFLIDEAALKRLKETSEFPAAVIDELRVQGTQYFKTRELFDEFITDKFTGDSLSLSEDEREIVADASRVFDNIHLTTQSITNIKAQLKGNIQNTGVPSVLIRLLSQIKDVSYPEVSLLRSAAISKMIMGIGACKMNSPTSNLYVAGLRMPDEEFDLLAKELSNVNPQSADGRLNQGFEPSKAFAELKRLRLQVSQCDKASFEESRRLIEEVYLNYLALPIENMAKKAMPDEIMPITLKGGDCGCALDDFAGVSYAFYPYWNNQKAAQTMNFHVLNRVAYLGLTVDNVGDFRLGAVPFDIKDGSSDANQFIRVAHQYNSKVDWVIQKNDWNGDWKRHSRDNKKAILSKLLTNIKNLLHTRLTDTASKLKPTLSLGLAEPVTRGDGVTIYFQNYPTDLDSTTLFNEFFLNLHKTLRKENVAVNIVMTQSVLSADGEGRQGAFALPNLIKLRNEIKSRSVAGDRDLSEHYFLVLLNEPSTDAKKQLRLDIESEQGLHGNARAEFLRNIIPVMQFDNHNWQQLEDDVVYASDNFGGMGLWAPDFENIAKPTLNMSESCARGQQIALCILRNFRESNQADRLPSAVARFACVNRWYLQIALTAFLLIAIVLAFLFAKFCEVQSFIKRYFLWVLGFNIVPALVIFVMLLLYDPYLTSLSKGNLPFIISIGIILAGVVGGYLYLRSQRELPQRQRALPQRQGLGFPIFGWKIETDDAGFRWVIRNRGTGYGIIKKVEILLDGHAVADAKTALEAVIGPNDHLVWKSLPLVGQKIMPGESIVALSITDTDAAQSFERKLREHQLQVMITYFSANNEHWITDGKEVSAVGAASF
ncbi:hypothetical protein RF679_18035 [Undibacterium cyanobacteriorum]|uniref:Peptidoglycan binding-like domain-containing protein n=1 Tax=Undibacterium cyanobacteriorum TaxID=3073561 RepID=A0ABY9RJH8_9BURK|nr:hypothetical protein [Undibacterium sp. 20NA77.5]WMW80517.1 hypothetical protein RF679_18035 [Undibacterium sp. 20NA77.5]